MFTVAAWVLLAHRIEGCTAVCTVLVRIVVLSSASAAINHFISPNLFREGLVLKLAVNLPLAT